MAPSHVHSRLLAINPGVMFSGIYSLSTFLIFSQFWLLGLLRSMLYIYYKHALQLPTVVLLWSVLYLYHSYVPLCMPIGITKCGLVSVGLSTIILGGVKVSDGYFVQSLRQPALYVFLYIIASCIFKKCKKLHEGIFPYKIQVCLIFYDLEIFGNSHKTF